MVRANQHLCNLFRDCTGLMPNTEKTESMSCHPGAIQDWCSVAGYKRRHGVTGETYSKRKEKRTACPRPGCGKALAIGFLQSHLRTQHGTDATGSMLTEPTALAPHLYKLSFIQQSGHSQHKVPCHVDGCRYTAATSANLRRHFFSRHYTYSLNIEEDGSVPSYCRAYGILISLIHCSGSTLVASSAMPTFKGTNNGSGMRPQRELRPEHSPLLGLS